VVDFHEIQQGGHTIEGDVDASSFNPVASTVPEQRMTRLVMWMQNLHNSTWKHEGLSLAAMVTTPFSSDS
jgi:hypothetical protein